jgi:hypothetical protein
MRRSSKPASHRARLCRRGGSPAPARLRSPASIASIPLASSTGSARVRRRRGDHAVRARHG